MAPARRRQQKPAVDGDEPRRAPTDDDNERPPAAGGDDGEGQAAPRPQTSERLISLAKRGGLGQVRGSALPWAALAALASRPPLQPSQPRSIECRPPIATLWTAPKASCAPTPATRAAARAPGTGRPLLRGWRCCWAALPAARAHAACRHSWPMCVSSVRPSRLPRGRCSTSSWTCRTACARCRAMPTRRSWLPWCPRCPPAPTARASHAPRWSPPCPHMQPIRRCERPAGRVGRSALHCAALLCAAPSPAAAPLSVAALSALPGAPHQPEQTSLQ